MVQSITHSVAVCVVILVQCLKAVNYFFHHLTGCFLIWKPTLLSPSHWTKITFARKKDLIDDMILTIVRMSLNLVSRLHILMVKIANSNLLSWISNQVTLKNSSKSTLTKFMYQAHSPSLSPQSRNGSKNENWDIFTLRFSLDF